MKTKWGMAFIHALVLSAAFSSLGCGVRPGYARKEWSNSLNQLGIIALYPAREDVYVGDVYAYAYDPDGRRVQKAFDKGDNRVGMTSRWSSLDDGIDDKNKQLLSGLNVVYQSRPIWPKTPDSYVNMLSGNVSDEIWDDANSGTSPIFQNQPVPNRLRTVAFPEFISASFTQGDLSGVIPVEALNVAFGASWNSAKSITVKIPSAASYSIPIKTALQIMTDGEKSLKPEFRQYLKVMGNRTNADLLDNKTEDSNAVWIQVMTEVYYARVMDISVQTNRTAGGKVSVAPAAGAGSIVGTTPDGSKPAPQQPSTAPKETEKASEAADPQATVFTRVKQMNQKLDEAGARTVPGGAVGFIGANDSSISLRRVWQYPVAIGFRAIVLKINKNTGEILGISSRSEGTTLRAPKL